MGLLNYKRITMKKRAVTILGATGSIGKTTLKVIDLYPEEFDVFALTANTNLAELAQLTRKYQPSYVVIANESKVDQLRSMLLGCNAKVLAGEQGLAEVASMTEVDVVVAAIVGGAGLLPTLAAAETGKQILFANKEALVMAGAQFIRAAKESGAILLPIDSEHNAIFQCLPAEVTKNGIVTEQLDSFGVEKLLLTASGGPFLNFDRDQLDSVTPEQACLHPNWAMGKKISVDSATMMNKGLEIIEATWLFNISASQIDVVIHPQSIIHSMVSYCDGSVLAQLGNPDMSTPIAYGLGWPDRLLSGVRPLNFYELCDFQFLKPNYSQFPCLALAYHAAEAAGIAPIILNASNEVAVAAFLEGRLQYNQIPGVVEKTLSLLVTNQEADSLDVILECDAIARATAVGLLNSQSRPLTAI